jgi:hypothetical protein
VAEWISQRQLGNHIYITVRVNQRGEEVCSFRRKLMVWKREHAPQRQFPYEDAALFESDG